MDTMSRPATGQMEQYVSCLERQKEQLRRAKAFEGQKPTAAMKRSRQQLESDFANLSPPCTKPLSSLTPITLRDLRLETHHRGRVLVARALSVPSRISAVMNAIEDGNGDVDRLAIHNLPRSARTERVLPSGAIVAVKEPYYKVSGDGGVLVRVDHRSDFILLKPDDALVPVKLRSTSTGNKSNLKKTPTQLKENGNSAFKQGDWEMAADCYTEALGLSNEVDDDLRHTLYRNRAGARLRLGHYEWAREDALASGTNLSLGDAPTGDVKSQNLKAFFRAGRAEYQLGNFAQAQAHFQRTLELDDSNKDALADLKRTTQRLAEQEDGQFDLTAMSVSVNENHVRLDHASFVKHTKIAPAGHRGRGLVATKDLKRSDLIMVEKAFCVAYEKEKDVGGTSSLLININTNRLEFGTHADRFVALVDKMSHNPEQAGLYLDLTDGSRLANNTKNVEVVDGKVVIDAFRVLAIAELNGFGCPAAQSNDRVGVQRTEGSPGGSTGIWLRASYCNHSCIPNADRSFTGDMMVVRANRDIKAGEEIFLGYYPPQHTYTERRKHLDFFGFQCDCALCTAESKEPAKMTKQRARLRNEADKFIAANKRTQTSMTVSAAKTKQGKGLLRRLRDTYDQKAFEKLPRLDCVPLGLWLSQGGDNSPREDLNNLLLLLRDMGYFFKLKGSGADSAVVETDRSRGVAMDSAVHAAMYASEACAAMGYHRAALAFRDFAKEGYVINYGLEEAFETRFG
ncbi:hypothetical protein B0H14DRAFT_3112485 [Mycena olivaceomarginata]|nr:hypothetical protein B0H14DRAFT_3112485 [Mycena olivaceomarginata]